MVVWIVECLLIVTVMMGIVLEQQKRLNRAREKGWEESSDFERMEGSRMACTLRDGGCCEKNRVVVRGLLLGHSHHTTGNDEMGNSIEIPKYIT